LYVPPSKRISDVVGRLRDEISGSANIKSKQTRTNVQRALTGIVARLSQYKIVPPNGLIIYCGEIVTRTDKTEFEYHCIIPSSPVKSFSYTCNSKFETEDAESFGKQSDIYALVVLDLHEACWGTVSGNNIMVLGTYDSIVPSKHSQGGQSAARFERLRDIAINEFFVKLGERVSTSILDIDLKGILIGGCGMTKDEFLKGNFLHHEIRKKIIGSFDTGYTNEHGLAELVDVSKDKLTGLRSIHEKEVFDEFLKLLAKDTGKCAYGIEHVFESAQNGKVKTLVVLENRGDLINKILPLSQSTNFTIETIALNSDSGNMLEKGFGGMVAILRY
jgi:peptide chain release factor subunit 1